MLFKPSYVQCLISTGSENHKKEKGKVYTNNINAEMVAYIRNYIDFVARVLKLFLNFLIKQHSCQSQKDDSL